MSDALQRWRERCARAAVKGEGIRWWQRKRRFELGLLIALDAAPVKTKDPTVAFALVALASLMHPVGPAVDGLRLALTWLREEVERG